MIRHPHVTGVVLAGGKASRLRGANKALLPVGQEPDDTILRRVLAVFAGRFAGAVVVGPDPEAYVGLPVTVTEDVIPGCGPIGGIHAALQAIRTPFAFVCGCDMPYLSGDLLDAMVVSLRPDSILVPVLDGRPEPLHAFYPATCRAAIERAIGDGIRKMQDFLDRAPVDYFTEERYSGIEAARRSFFNVNTPDDLKAAQRTRHDDGGAP